MITENLLIAVHSIPKCRLAKIKFWLFGRSDQPIGHSYVSTWGTLPRGPRGPSSFTQNPFNPLAPHIKNDRSISLNNLVRKKCGNQKGPVPPGQKVINLQTPWRREDSFCVTLHIIREFLYGTSPALLNYPLSVFKVTQYVEPGYLKFGSPKFSICDRVTFLRQAIRLSDAAGYIACIC